MAKNKKELTASQKKTKYRALQYACFGGEILSVLAPFITLGIANADEWFTTTDGWKVGLGGALLLALVGIAVFLVSKKTEKGLSNGWITLMVGWFAVAFIFVLLGSIINQIASIMLWGGLGLLGAFGLDITKGKMKEKADAYKEALGEVKKESILDEAKREVELEKKRKKGLM